MSVSAYDKNTQTASIGTEHTLKSVTAAGAFAFEVDCVNMATGDVVELRLYKICLTGGTKQLVAFAMMAGAQPAYDTYKTSDWFLNDLSDANALQFTLKQAFGTGRNFPWKVMQLDDATITANQNVNVNQWGGGAVTTFPTGTVSSDAGNTASTFKTDRTESTNDFWKDALLLFTSGSLAGQVKKVSAYNCSTKFVTLSSAFTAAPSASDAFVILNR